MLILFLFLTTILLPLEITQLEIISLIDSVRIDDSMNMIIERVTQYPIEPDKKCDICVIERNPDFFDWADFFSNLAGIAIPVIGAFTFYFGKKRGLRKRIVESILSELDENQKDLFTQDEVIKSRKKPFRGWVFVTYAFDSAVNSGDFSHFKPETQKELSLSYQEMKVFNQLLNNMNAAFEMINLQKKELTPDQFYEQNKFLKNLRSQIIGKIPDVKKLTASEKPRHFAF